MFFCGCGEGTSGTVNNIQQINDMTHGFIVEDGHIDNQPDHGLKREFPLAQGDGISEGKSLLDEVGGRQVSEALNLVGCSKIDNAESV
jgi:hypothetical protein